LAVNATLTVVTENDSVARLVGDFAKGLGCAVETLGGGVRVDLADTGDTVFELLDYVALSATKAGVTLTEPLCRFTFRRGASARVTLGLRLTEFSIDS
jgi:hypothetical protein